MEKVKTEDEANMEETAEVTQLIPQGRISEYINEEIIDSSEEHDGGRSKRAFVTTHKGANCRRARSSGWQDCRDRWRQPSRRPDPRVRERVCSDAGLFPG